MLRIYRVPWKIKGNNVTCGSVIIDDMPAEWARDFQRKFPQATLQEPMSLHTTFRIGGPADAYLELLDEDDVASAFSFASKRSVPIVVVGWGSNLLVRDGGIRGIVIRLRGIFETIEFRGNVHVWAGAGVRLPALVTACASRGLKGSEPLVGVPGTVGGALVMNAGTREGEIGSLVTDVRVFDPKCLQAKSLNRSQVHFSYRESNLSEYIILGTELELKVGNKVDILKRVHELQQRRLQTQPIHTYNVGSTFKNPTGHFTADLIEKAGLKGARCGGAIVSQKHSNFFENEGNATANDVLGLVNLVRRRIKEQFGVDLELEMKVIGEA